MLIDTLKQYAEFLPTVENTNINLNDYGRSKARIFHAAMGLAGEGGEVLEIFKKNIFGKNKPINYEELEKELGDVWFYFWLAMDALAELEGLPTEETFERIIKLNIEKLNKRYEVRNV